MSTEINLLPRKTRAKFSQEQLLAYSKIGAIIACIITVSFAIVLFLLNRDPSLSQIQAQQQNILTQLTILHTKTAKDLIIVDRVKRITKILQSRKALEKDIDTIQSQLQTSLTVTSFALDDKHVLLTVSGQSLSPMGAFIESLTDDIQKKKFLKKITIQGIISDEKTGNFLLSISGDLL